MNSTLGKLGAFALVLLALSATGQAAEPSPQRVSLDISGHPYKGPSNAPVTLVVFSDYL